MSTEITAKLRFLRVAPRKVRLVTDIIRGRRVLKAVETLSLLNKRAARPVLKLLKSAMANAKHNNSLEPENLRVFKITVDGGPVLKRWMPKAHGRATPVRERTSHINLVLVGEEPKVAKKESAPAKASADKEKKKKVKKEKMK